MKLYIANKNYSSWSLRPWVLMKTVGLPFEESLHPFPVNGGPTGFDAFSPTSKVPVLVDGEHSIWDSLAITEYLAEQHPSIWPEDKTARAWARSAAAEMHSGFANLRHICAMSCGVRVALHQPAPAGLLADLKRLQTLWTDGLQRFGGPFLLASTSPRWMRFFAQWRFGCRPITWCSQMSAWLMCKPCWLCPRCKTGTPAP